MSDDEFRAVVALDAPERYEYFIKRAAGHGALWGLRDSDGWVIAGGEADEPHFPVWPHARYATACAAGAWQGARPESIDIDEWVEAWLPKMAGEGMSIAVFQTADDQATSVSAERLKHDLDEELEKFSLGS